MGQRPPVDREVHGPAHLRAREQRTGRVERVVDDSEDRVNEILLLAGSPERACRAVTGLETRGLAAWGPWRQRDVVGPSRLDVLDGLGLVDVQRDVELVEPVRPRAVVVRVALEDYAPTRLVGRDVVRAGRGDRR